jgi:hypothetical protein
MSTLQTKRPAAILALLCLLSMVAHTQLPDSLKIESNDNGNNPGIIELPLHRPPLAQSMIIPISFTAYGFVALNNNKLHEIDNHIKDEVWNEHPHQPAHFDNFLQYMPGFSVYVLNGLGIPGKNNLLDATRQYLLSSFAMMLVVQSIKRITSLSRPDGFGKNTFPSGHTSTAFVAAEFLNQEYGQRSFLYSVAGYTMATVVGYMRIYDNRHWFKDIVSGAGIGMGITKLVYYEYPWIKKKFFKDRKYKQVHPY